MKVVFAGPSIYGQELGLKGIDLRPPAASGDVLRATLEGATVIGLIDGTFGGNASVWHKEILFALQEGVTVLGGASMGALRAAECATFGMVPIGAIAKAYLDGEIDDDAWVALVHGPAEFGNVPLSEPLVDFEATVKRLRDRGLLSAEETSRLLATSRDMYFADRTAEAVAEAALSSPRSGVFVDLYDAHKISVKAADAKLLIETVSDLDDRRISSPSTWALRETQVWRDTIRQLADGTARD